MSKYFYPVLIIAVIAVVCISAIYIYSHDGNLFSKDVKADQQTGIFLDGDEISLSVPCVNENGYMLGPAEDISVELGAGVEKKNTNSIEIVKGDTVLLLTVNSREMQVNGKAEMLPVPVRKVKDVIMAPVRYLAEKLGAGTGWDAETKSILLTTGEKGSIVFLGDSLTANFKFQEYFDGIVNKGKSGDTTFGAIGRLNQIIMMKPKKLFIMLGTNDVWRGIDHNVTLANYRHIINTIRMSCPDTEIIVQSTLPMGAALERNVNAPNENIDSLNEKIDSLNLELISLAVEYSLSFVDVGSLYKDNKGRLDAKYSNDGIHIFEKSYKIWADEIKDLVVKGNDNGK